MTMKRIVTCSLVLAAGLSASAQSIYIPPDYFGEDYKKSIGFWENDNQVVTTDGHPAKDVRFYSEGGMPRAYLRERSQVSFTLAHVDTIIATMDTLWRLDMRPYGPHAQVASPVGFVQKDWTQNFYLPWCGDSGVTDVQGYCRVVYPEIFPKIDMHFYSGSAGQKMAFVMRPGCDPADLKLAFTGQDSIKLDLWGALKIYYDGKFMEMPFAQAYQVGAGNTIIPVSWVPSYNVNNGTGVVSFQYSSYNPSLPLVFQVGPPPALGGGPAETPGVCWAAYLGGDGEDQVFASDVDAQNNYYVSGETFTQDINFPVHNGQVTIQASPRVFATKFNANDGLEWSDLYGCSTWPGDQVAYALTAKPNDFPGDKLFIGGVVSGNDLYQAAPDGAWHVFTEDGPSCGFIAELRKNDGHIEWSTYFGGYGSVVYNMDIDKYGRLVLTGSNSGDLPDHTVPLPPNAEQWPFTSGSQPDAFVAIIRPDHQILWSTYIGGTSFDAGYSVRYGGDKIVVAGISSSPSLPTHDAGNGGQYVTNLNGPQDTFIMEFDLNGQQLWGTYVGYGASMGFQGLAVNQSNGDVFLTGYIQLGTLPVTSSAPWYDDTYSGTDDDGFILQFSGSDQTIQYASYISADEYDEPRAVVVLPDGQFIVAGLTFDNSFETRWIDGLYTEQNMMGAGDGFIMAFTQEHDLAWATYFGGDEDPNTHADCIRTLTFKGNDRLYAAGYTDAAYDQGQFFPLHDEGGGAWPDQTFDPTADGFVSAFCIQGVLTGISELSLAGHIPGVSETADGQWQVSNLGVGPHRYVVTDALGRIVKEGVLHGGGQSLIETHGLTDGTYVVNIADERAQRAVLICR